MAWQALEEDLGRGLLDELAARHEGRLRSTERARLRELSYSPSATVLKYLQQQPRPDRHAGLLALGDPVYERSDKSSEPKPLPDHGLLINLVARGSNAANHGLKNGDVLLAYNGKTLNKKDDLDVVAKGTTRSQSTSGETARRPGEIWPPASSASRSIFGRHRKR
jgi:hypothetical protein